jgi:PTH1 family peptidyl-tRNA hydrolase
MMWINKLWGIFRNQTVNDEMMLPAAEAPLDSSDKFLIVGLGNTGRKYRRNRHNIGFMVVDRLAELHNIQLSRVQNKALVGNGRIANQSVILAKPQTMMNLSGDAVGPIANYYNIPPANVLVIYDELDLPLGTTRLREKGGAGGHNGMKSIINHLGNNFPRLRLGIGRPPGRMPPAAYVLQDFGKDDEPAATEMIDTAVTTIQTYLSDGINLAMTKHNNKPKAEG